MIDRVSYEVPGKSFATIEYVYVLQFEYDETKLKATDKGVVCVCSHKILYTHYTNHDR